MKSFFNAVTFLFFAFAFSGCTSTVGYKSQTASGPAKPLVYPIPVYNQQQKVPRPTEIIGTVSVNAGKFTMFGGNAETEMGKIFKRAHEEGADAIKLLTIEKPDFANPHYRMKASLLRYADIWETVSLSEKDFRNYLATHAANLDPIEGIWISTGLNSHTIAIIKNDSMSGREFVGFILDSKNPVWPAGTKKIDIRRGLEAGSYILVYYLDDFERREVPIILGQKRIFRINVPRDEEDRFITYTKE
ncbi:MAG TPA: hypothetical protein VN516_05275 [Candidatus Baltobacteraceae bacterium]|nr:hypothetical protein [Candidatus Baltobacteraceae bacterium]